EGRPEAPAWKGPVGSGRAGGEESRLAELRNVRLAGPPAQETTARWRESGPARAPREEIAGGPARGNRETQSGRANDLKPAAANWCRQRRKRRWCAHRAVRSQLTADAPPWPRLQSAHQPKAALRAPIAVRGG